MEAQPRDWRADRREIHLFPVLRVPAFAGNAAHLPSARQGAGKSNVGFALSKQEVAERLDQIWAARGEGHEIASHGCGHFDGDGWSKADWLAEFASFTTILRDAYAVNGIAGEPEGWRRFAETEIKGFRAPYLSTGKGLYAALGVGQFHL